jgi:D-ala D-ala ligase C-terminus
MSETESMSDVGSENGDATVKPIAIYYEQPNWFVPLFAQMDARGVAWKKVDARYHCYDAASPEREYSLLFNRMSPSAWQRGVGHGVFYTLNYLKHLEDKGVRVVNGYKAFTTETSKALQLSLMERLGLLYPKARVINHPSQALRAGEEIGYPLILKPNIGGSGAGIKKFTSSRELKAAVDAGELYFGIDNVALVQECFTARDRTITRVEVLGGKYLYAIQIHITGETFDLCPADICKSTKGEELTRIACPVDAPKTGMTVEAYEAPPRVIANVERLMEGAGIEVGGVEYVIDDPTGRLLYYDINALSNFVADPERIVGFNPYSRLADYLIAEAGKHSQQRGSAGGEPARMPALPGLGERA